MNDTTTGADNYFAIIPEWVLFSDISANAVRLYCVLRRRADKQSGKCYPSRTTLAKDMQVGSVSSVHRAMKELVEIGAVLVSHRKINDEYTSNIYTVISTPPTGVLSQVTLPSTTDELGTTADDRGVLSQVTLGTTADDTQTKVIKPKSINQSHLRKDIDNDFEKFWEIYPRKTGKGAARESFRKALKKAQLDKIFAGALAYATDPNRENAFTALATTWLNQERWDDSALLDRNQTTYIFSKADTARNDFMKRWNTSHTSIEG